MNYLVDTHVLLWYMENNPKLSAKAIAEIENRNNVILISKASLWEISLKVSTGKLRLAMPILELENYLNFKSIIQLDFNFSDLEILSRMPFHHNDPFDRLIIAQGINQKLVVISDDPKFNMYPVELFK